MNILLEFIIGLVFTFMVFSLATSWIVEYISLLKQRRARMLKDFLVSALDDQFNANWGQLVYGHPLIDVLHRQLRLTTLWDRILAGTQLSTKRRLPMYIPAEQFAKALVDVVISHSQPSIFIRNDSTGKYVLKPQRLTGRSFQDFLNAVDELQESETKITLAALARPIQAGTGREIAELEAAIAHWYEAGMERLTGWYKRETRKWLFAIGLLVAVAMNVDTLNVARTLYSNPTVRTAVANAGAEYVRRNPIGPAGGSDTSLRLMMQRIDSVQREMTSLGLPIGWQPATKPLTFWEHVWEAIAKHWIGWLLTAFAISFGAPFWFDVLKQFVNMRSAGVKPGERK